MTMQTEKFIDHFWGSEFNSTTGFDRLTAKMKQGKQSLTDYIEFVKKRSQIELRYGQDMCKLANSVLGRGEVGTLHSSLEIFQKETDEIGKLALQCSKLLTENIQQILTEFRDNQRETRRPYEDNVKKSIRNKKSSYDQLQRCKQAYERACVEADKSSEILQQNMTQPQRKVDQLKAKMKSSRLAAETANKEYEDSVKTLEVARQNWESDYSLYTKKMQSLEEDRLQKLRNSLWNYTNLCSQTLVETDQRLEEVRKSLEHCDLRHDLNLYIKQNKTGTNRPEAIGYENYYNSNVRIDEEVKKNSLPRGPALHYERVVAMYEYNAQGPEELELAPGDLLVVVQKVDDMWWYGKHKNGNVGVFPVSYVREIPMS
ncbi:hypothetical protein ACHWQZ_G012932 [Mnemiopsis leidyi]